MITTIALPGNALASTTAYIGSTFGSLAPFIYLAIGLPLAFLVIYDIIKIFDFANVLREADSEDRLVNKKK